MQRTGPHPMDPTAPTLSHSAATTEPNGPSGQIADAQPNSERRWISKLPPFRRLLLHLTLIAVLLFAITRQEKASVHHYTDTWDFPSNYVMAIMARFRPHAALYVSFSSPAEAIGGKIDFGNGVVTLRYHSPPELALMLTPLTRISLDNAYRLLRILNYLLLAVTCFLLSRKNWFLLFVAAVCSFPFYWLQYHGQFGVVILFLWVAGTLLEERGNNWWSAFCFVIATLVKMTPALILLLFIFQKKWRWVLAYCTLLLAALAIGVGIQGWPNHVLFWQDLRAMSSGIADWNSLSIPSLAYNVWRGSPHGPAPTAFLPLWLTLLMKSVSFLILLAVLWRRRTSASIAAASLAIAPFSWCHYYMLALFPLVRKWRLSPAMVAAAVSMGTCMMMPVTDSVLLMATTRLLVPLAALFLAFAPEPGRTLHGETQTCLAPESASALQHP